MYILAVKDERGALVSEHQLSDQLLHFGRTNENEIVLSSKTISRQHACIYLENDRIYIGDMGSANGVFIDDRRIQGEVEVQLENKVRIGEFTIQLERLEEEPTGVGINTAQVAPEKAHGKLVLLGGPQAGREVLLFEPIVTIGRVEENDVHLPDISVSRHHARLHSHHDGGYVLQDLGSSNGTHLLGRKVTKAVRVAPGDRIHFGNIECLLAATNRPTRARASTRKLVIYGLLAFAAAVLGTVIAVAFQG